jgi:hypothetical protein
MWTIVGWSMEGSCKNEEKRLGGVYILSKKIQEIARRDGGNLQEIIGVREMGEIREG